jgi:hypothetical protein
VAAEPAEPSPVLQLAGRVARRAGRPAAIAARQLWQHVCTGPGHHGRGRVWRGGQDLRARALPQGRWPGLSLVLTRRPRSAEVGGQVGRGVAVEQLQRVGPVDAAPQFGVVGELAGGEGESVPSDGADHVTVGSPVTVSW